MQLTEEEKSINEILISKSMPQEARRPMVACLWQIANRWCPHQELGKFKPYDCCICLSRQALNQIGIEVPLAEKNKSCSCSKGM